MYNNFVQDCLQNRLKYTLRTCGLPCWIQGFNYCKIKKRYVNVYCIMYGPCVKYVKINVL